MTAEPPPATGARLDWSALPERVRAAVEAWLGGPVVRATSQATGSSPGVAARLRTANGRRAFVKAVAPQPNPDAPAHHRREARIVGALPSSAPVPRLLWTYDEGDDGWVVLAFEDIEGQPPATPWRPAELDRVLAALATLTTTLTPSPLAAAEVGGAGAWYAGRRPWWRLLRDEPPAGLDAWSRRHAAAFADLEAGAAAAVAGDTLLHLDLRADNMLLTPDRVLVVDWPHARVGAAWIDLVFFAPSVAMQGGPSPEALLARHPATRAAPPDALTAGVAVVAGFFTHQALQPTPPGLPTLRAFQDAQGRVARRWLAERTGR
jgi:aminoglycoside phosphotransferase (APT) family kinase protein